MNSGVFGVRLNQNINRSFLAFLGAIVVLPLVWLWGSYRLEQLSSRLVAVEESRILVARALRDAVDEESGVRDYIEMDEPLGVQSYNLAHPRLVALLSMLPSQFQQAGFTTALPELHDFIRLQNTWERTVAAPLLAKKPPADVLSIEKNGKVLMDGMRDDVLKMHAKGTLAAAVAVKDMTGLLIVAVTLTALWILLVFTLTFILQRRAVRYQNSLVESLVHEREESTRLSQWRSRLLAMLAHDFKSQLTVLIGASHLLEDFPHRRSDPELLASLRNAAYELAQMADNAILLARTQERKIVLQRGAFDIGEVLESVVQRYGNEREFEIHRSSPTVMVDADRLYCARVLDNVIGNAVKYSEKPVSIYLDEDATQVKVSIVDRGIGIAPEELPHIFDEYWRSDRATWKTKGSGIGLFIVRTIMEAHGGSIEVHSTYGQGTTVILTLPRAHVAFPAVEARVTTPALP